MNAKNLLLTTIFLSLAVLIGGGIFYYVQLKKLQETYIRISYGEFIIPQGGTSIVSQTNLNSVGKSSPTSKSVSSSTGVETFLPANQSPLQYTPSAGSSSANYVATNRYSAGAGSKIKSDDRIIASGGSELLALGGVSGRKSSGMRGNEGGSTSFGSTAVASATTLMGAPTPLSNSGQILIDPTPTDPDPNTRLPVGDGLWALLAMGLAYLVFRRRNV